ncbi:MAG: hypothetical protein A3F46_06475 [Legionellales bacterium RIFCSPHIGHO2_12_FULL_42_9]|nr:MAG: hypothetical protein A3F46_06475 [Legionellales bacterium RIFCSPHIGHO2_12_FULL_42_9]
MPRNITEIKTIVGALDGFNLDPEETLVAVDLDNTVEWPHLDLGGDAWYHCLLNEAAAHILDEETRKAFVIAIYRSVQCYVRTQPVEPEIVPLIKALQDKGVFLLAVTARDECLKEATVRQLKDIGVKIPLIIHCDGGDKGHKLKEFMDKEFIGKGKKLPSHIVMFDDKEHHLICVADVVESLGISFTGFRYAFLDEKVKQFDMSKANGELAYIKEWLPELLLDTVDKLHLAETDPALTLSPTLMTRGFFALEPSRQYALQCLEISESDRTKTLS